MTDIATIAADFFRPHLDTPIAFADSEGNVVLAPVLLRVEDRPTSTMPGAPRQAFGLSLAAPLPCDIADGNFTLGHPVFGTVGPVHVTRIIPADNRAWFRIYFG